MFIAGIELFFGFVAGLLILCFGLVFVWFGIPAIVRGVIRAFRRAASWTRERSEWIAGFLIYCWAVFALCKSENAWANSLGGLLIVALLVKLFVISGRHAKPTPKP
jgi:uncharacterized membrane protein